MDKKSSISAANASTSEAPSEHGQTLVAEAVSETEQFPEVNSKMIESTVTENAEVKPSIKESEGSVESLRHEIRELKQSAIN